jgi:2-polyprenyl-3-methyl-5-hydroxy-6-metoxy-1,4-benzoquinol methylase
MKAEYLNTETQHAIYESLETLSQTPKYYRWLCSRVQRYIRGKTLELGAGIGNFAQWASTFATEYHATDVDPILVERLKQDFPKAFRWDLFEPFPGDDLYDTVIILNVIEHLQDDAGAMEALFNRLQPGGHLIVMVPAMHFLYGSLDRAFGHYRRYHKSEMIRLMEHVNLDVVRDMYLNIAGMFGWYLYGKILKHDQLPQELCSRFNLVLPLLKIERPLAYFAGLSLITVGRKCTPKQK